MADPSNDSATVELGWLGRRPRLARHERHLTGPAGGQIHVRTIGSGPPLVMLHMSPLTSAHLMPLAAELAGTHTCLVIDTPGYGHSDPLEGDPEIGDFAGRILAGLADWDLRGAALYGSHTGAKIALAMALTEPDAFSTLVLDGLRLTDQAQRTARLAEYIPELPPVADGSHLLESWDRVWRTSADWKFFPDTRTRCEEVNWLLVPELTARPWYGQSYRAAFRCDPAHQLAAVDAPVLLLTRSTDELGRRTPTPRLPHVSSAEADDTAGESQVAAAIVDHLAGRPGGSMTRPDTGNTARAMISTPGGGIEVRRRPAIAGRPTVRIHTPLAPRLPGEIEIDLPGTGGSEWEAGAWSGPAAGDAITAGLALMGITPAAVELDPSSLTPDAPLWPALRTARPVPDGSHLTRVWSALRDSQPDPADLAAVHRNFSNLLRMSIDPVGLAAPAVLVPTSPGGDT